MNNSLNIENNNRVFTTSTPKIVNGNFINDNYNSSNGNYTLPIEDENSSPIRFSEKEKIMNSINANSSTNGTIGTNTTTVIADIEGEVRKKYKYSSDKTYYIAKEILMTELTYKKDLDVINVVSIYFFIPCKQDF